MRSSTAVLIKNFTIMPSLDPSLSGTETGVYILYDSGKCNVTDCIIADFNNTNNRNYYGIRLDGTQCAIHGNVIKNNIYGIGLYNSMGNRIYHNKLSNNTVQAYINGAYNNAWDDGYPSGGNYWSDYVERYPDAQELDDSGIWDTPYVIDGNNQDNYPLMALEPQPDFKISSDPTLRSIYPGQSTTYNVTVVSSNGFDSPISLDLSNLPENATYAFDPPVVTPPPGGSVESTLSIDTQLTLAPDIYYLTITGSSSKATHTTGVTLAILSEDQCSLTIDSSPESGVIVRIDSIEQATPYLDLYAFETTISISAPSFARISGSMHLFDHWADDHGFLSTLDSISYEIPSTSAVTLIAYYVEDTAPPTITHTPITTANEGQSVSITATITDNVAVAEASLFYRKTTEAVYSFATMTGLGNTYSGTIPASAITTAGVQYFINATDGINYSTNPEENPATSPHTITVANLAPPPVTLSTPYDVTENSMKLTWTSSAIADFKQYEIYRAISSDELGTRIQTITEKATTGFVVSALSPDVVYYYRIRVVDTGDLYADSNQASAKTLPETIPPTVTMLVEPMNPDATETVVFTVTAGDTGGSGISDVSLYVDDTLVKTWTEAGTHTYEGGPYSAGTHTYYATACDSAGNICREPASSTRSFNVVSRQETLPLPLLLIAAIAGISLLAALLFILLRKK